MAMWSQVQSLIMLRLSWLVMLVLLTFPGSSSLAQQALKAKPRCADAQNTLEMGHCIQTVLNNKDVALRQAMQRLATSARNNSSASFNRVWSDQLKQVFNTSTDPNVQFEAFRKARRNACIYMNSLALGGSGFSIFTSNCEIDMTDVLLRRLGD